MSNLTTALRLLYKNPGEFCASLLFLLSPYIHDDKWYLKLLFRFKQGYWMDFSHPKTFCEKLQWLKINNRRPELTQMVDKYAVKTYVAKKIDHAHILKTIGVWDTPQQIKWDILPSKFVLKATNGGGGNVVICRDIATLDRNKAIEKLSKALLQDNYSELREWPYKNVRRRIIAEEYLEPEEGQSELTDYKFYCFNGLPKYCQVIKDRNSQETIDFFDMAWNRQEFIGLNIKAKHSLNEIPQPKRLELMQQIASVLSYNLPFVRVDLYESREKVFFGELTFYPNGGFGTFSPQGWDMRLGKLLKININ